MHSPEARMHGLNRALKPGVAVLGTLVLWACTDVRLCGGIDWYASAGVPGGRGARAVELVTYNHQLYGLRRTDRPENDAEWDRHPQIDEEPACELVVRDVGPKHVMLFSAAGMPLSVDMTVQPWRVVETDDEESATIWDEDEDPKRPGQGLPFVKITQWSMRHQGKTYFLSVATTPEHILRIGEYHARELYPVILDENPPQRVRSDYLGSRTPAPER